MAQLLPIVCKFFPSRMVGGLLCVYVHLNLASMVVTLSGVADVLPGRDLGSKVAAKGGPNPGLKAALLGS